jgi:cbb3-type cytochrome oxidase maturation protein
MEAGVILLLLGLVLLSGSALAAFFWAAGDGQLENLEQAPEVIFDASEPVGEPGDCFPDARSREARAHAASQR